MRGGYLILDFGGAALLEPAAGGASTSVKIPGLYNRIEGNHGKPILIENVVCEGTALAAQYAVPELQGTSYILKTMQSRDPEKTALFEIVVTQDDEVNVVPTV